jgi:transcription-repair coupling factor (superfamily II helicase)
MPADSREIKLSSSLAQAFAAYRSATQQKRSIQVMLLPRTEQIEELQLLLQSFIDAERNEVARPIEVCLWPAWEHSPFSPVSSSITQKTDRLRTLSLLSNPTPSLIILASLESWIQPTLPQTAFDQAQFEIELNDDAGLRDVLRQRLRNLGYTPSELVQEPGQFAFRGEILDVFIPTHSMPARIEFFDTIPETIRFFHPETQRTQKTEKPLQSILISPAEEVLFPWNEQGKILERIKEYCDQNQISRKVRDPIFENVRNGFLPDHFRTWFPFVYENLGHLKDYLPQDAVLSVFEPEQIQLELTRTTEFLKKEEAKYSQPYWITPSFDRLYPALHTLINETLNQAQRIVRAAPENLNAKSPIPFDPLPSARVTENDIEEWLEDGFKVWVGTRGLTHQERLRFSLKKVQKNIGFKLLSFDSGESFQFLTEKQIILSETAIFGQAHQHSKRPSQPRHPKFEQTEGLDFQHHQDLAVGDFVVHSLHGVGKYVGLQELKSGNKHLGEYLLIEYSGGDKLYLPVYRLNTIQRYVASGGSASLDKLGTGQFEKAKQKARESARKLAINLVEIYAKRALLKGPRFDPPGDEYYEFCDQFEFTETEGQLKAIQDVLQDLEAGKLLDRLVCGDVGFGKTEVAIRAAFQAVQSGHQVALLVPTTLLAFQHEQSFKNRMKDFPIRIESISRFKTKKIQNETLKELKEGKIDILIGTHRILSKDVEWNRLGLLMIDEEHRFGVEHKEKIKAIQANTHTLTLTATPIPRTLNMAISGLKDISVIKTPPTNRQPIKNYVSSYSEELIKGALETELARGGQVFYLYNRVQSIQHQADELQKLVPHAKVIVAHGQMSEAEIESKMLEFYQGQAQILVCTTIIESGIDVPNAGTILIHRADQLGLAQLYQIRGRVGRSHRKAFAYLLVNDESTLTNDAKMRLDVLQRFVELGSGFQIASYDLEIRGGGNFLGGEQSGHVTSVGLDLFTELLEEAIQELKGQKIDVEERHFEPEIQVPAVCEISSTLVPDAKLRLSLYRKISNARTPEMVDALFEEFRDRFGEVPMETENLFWLIRLKNLLKRAGIEQLSVTGERTSMTVRKTSQVDADEVMKIYAGPKTIRDPRVQLTPDSKILLTLPFFSLQSHLFELEAFLKKIAPKAFENAKTH